MDIKKILEYQKKDLEAIRLEKSLDENEDKKIFTNMLAVAKDAQNKSAGLEKSAEDLVHDYNGLKKIYEDNIKTLENIKKKDLEKLSEEEVNSLKEVMGKITSNLNLLEKKLLAEADNVKKVLDDFENTKKRYVSAKNKYSEHKEKFDAESAKLQPELEKIQKELKSLESSVDPILLAKYKSKRSDKFFPIYVPVRGNSCGGCMMELPMAVVEKVKKEGVLECENCRRMMYIED